MLIECPATEWESEMARVYIDCREFPTDMKCSVSMAADTPQELLEVAVQHAVTVHGHEDSSELRNEIGKMFKPVKA